MKEIKAIIFDWGGVLIDDPAPGLMQYCASALKVSKKDFIEVYRKFISNFGKGIINEGTFWLKICAELAVAVPKIDSLWGQAFKAVYKPKAEMFSLARSLRKNGYKIGFLSNTEAPAMQHFQTQGYDIFDATVFSCAEGIEKPERKIYELVLERLGTTAAQSIFIDDKEDYIKGAKEAGLNTILFKTVEQTKSELLQFLVKID